jgi:uncharacterized protein (DUF2147 family)
MRLVGVAALLWAGLPAAAQQPQVAAPAGPVGEWLVAKKVARIKIADCDGKLWGIVSWEAQPGVDTKNSDDQLRGRPTLGMPVLLGMQQTGSNKWEGQIYNSKDGHTYAATISMRDLNTLRVQGCFLELLCGGENWTRVEEPPPQAQPQRTAPRTTPRGSEPATPQTDPICSSIPGVARPSH